MGDVRPKASQAASKGGGGLMWSLLTAIALGVHEAGASQPRLRGGPLPWSFLLPHFQA